jgi:hypothetical protein
MTDHVAGPQFAEPPLAREAREAARSATEYWWLFLVAGIAWLLIALVILQFDQASITTVGVLVGLMFALAAIQNFAVASLPDRSRWVAIVFGVIFAISAVVCLVNPKDTFAGMADILGFLFLMVGIWWMVRAFIERPVNPSWWVGLISGILMTTMAFWTAGQFFITRAYVLLVFAGIWALMEGTVNIVRAFELHRAHDEL